MGELHLFKIQINKCLGNFDLRLLRGFSNYTFYFSCISFPRVTECTSSAWSSREYINHRPSRLSSPVTIIIIRTTILIVLEASISIPGIFRQFAFTNQKFNFIFQLPTIISLMSCILIESTIQVLVSFFGVGSNRLRPSNTSIFFNIHQNLTSRGIKPCILIEPRS